MLRQFVLRAASKSTELRIFVIACLWLAGCSVPQLRDQTVSVGSSAGRIYASQVLENLYYLASDSNAVPSHFSFAKGMIQTSNSVTPGVSVPIGNQVKRGFVTSTAPFGITEVDAPTKGVTLQATEEWHQDWEIVPEKDPRVLRYLNYIYRYVLHPDNLLEDADIQAALAPPAPAPIAPSALTTAKTSCNTNGTSISCSFQQSAAPPPGDANTKIPTKYDVDLINKIKRNCAGCFKVKTDDLCIETHNPLPPPASGSDWVCLSGYNSFFDRLVQHEMLISRDAYTKNVLFDLVILSLQLQSEAASKPSKDS